jgi:hypothetical protein
MSDLSIDKGIPMPEERSGWGKFGNTIREMEVGDSVLVTEQRDVPNLQASAKRIGLRMTSRKVEGGWRVWRIK